MNIRKVIGLVIFVLAAQCLPAQFYPGTLSGSAVIPGTQRRTPLNSLERSPNVAGRTLLTDAVGNLRWADFVEIEPVAIPFIPAASGNVAFLSSFVTAPTGDIYYIDWLGRGLLLRPATAAVTDRDWLKISNNGIPQLISDSIYTDNYASVNMRRVWPNAQFLVGDSTALTGANAVVVGNRDARVGFYRLTDNAWSSIGQEGSSLTARIGTGSTSLLVQTAAGASSSQPAGPFRNIFEVKRDSTIRLYDYPTTRRDTQSGTNYLYTDAQGYLRSKAFTGGGGAGIDTIRDYTALRSYAGSSLVVFVQNFTYTFNGMQYTTLGGIFRRLPGIEENGGTHIVGVFAWARDWDKVNSQPEWWQCGGYDTDGNVFVTKNISTGIGGKIAGIFSDSDRINAAYVISGNIKLQSRTYLLDVTVQYQNLDMNGATLKLNFTDPTTLTAIHVAGTQTITVANASGFRCGQQITIVDVTKPYGGLGDFEDYVGSVSNNVSGLFITNISGNTITFLGTTYVNIPIGGKVGVISLATYATGRSRIFGGTIDGSYDPAKTVTHAWYNGGLSADNHFVAQIIDSLRFQADNMRFLNHPNTAIIAGNLVLNNISLYNIGGGLYHVGLISGNFDNGYVIVNGVVSDSTGWTGYRREVQEHQEAFFTNSSNPRNIFITNVRATRLYNMVLGDVNMEVHTNIFISNCSFSGRYGQFSNTLISRKYVTKIACGANPPQVLDKYASFRMENCELINMGDFFMQGNDLYKGWYVSNVKLINNKFTNTRIAGWQCSNVDIIGNYFYTRPNFEGFTNYTYPTTLNTSVTRSAAISCVFCDRINVRNNVIEGDSLYNEFHDYGILLEAHGVFKKNSTGVNSLVYYLSNSKISGNTIIGHSCGIGFISRRNDPTNYFTAPLLRGTFLGIEVSNNTIQLEKYAQYSDPLGRLWGVQCHAGMSVFNNTIILPQNVPTNPLNGICVQGVESDLNTQLEGATVSSNKVYGRNAQVAIFCGNVASPLSLTFNNSVTNNTIRGTIDGVGGSYVANNFLMQSVLPALNNPYIIPDLIYYGQNKSAY